MSVHVELDYEAMYRRSAAAEELLRTQVQRLDEQINLCRMQRTEIEARAEAAEAELALYRIATEPVDKLPWRDWNFANVKVRINGEFREFEGDWLKALAYLREGRHDIVKRYFPDTAPLDSAQEGE